MADLRTLLDGLVLGESPRWHQDRLWVCDWGTGEVLTVALDGTREVVARGQSLPFCIDWLPDGRLLVVSSGRLLREASDGSLAVWADLTRLSDRPWNEVAGDGRGGTYVNGIGFDLMTGEPPGPGLVALVDARGTTREVAAGLAFPNGMAVTGDGSTLLVAESYAGVITAFDITADGSLTGRRVWADLAGGAPDGICLDAEGAVWYADVPNRACVRVAEGGQVLEVIELDRGCFSCALGGPDGRTLFMTVAEWRGPEGLADGTRTGRVVTTRAPAPRPG